MVESGASRCVPALFGVHGSSRLIAIYNVGGAYAGLRRAAGADHGRRLAKTASSPPLGAVVLWCCSSAATVGSMAGIAGAVIYTALQDGFASLTPQYWQLGIASSWSAS